MTGMLIRSRPFVSPTMPPIPTKSAIIGHRAQRLEWPFRRDSLMVIFCPTLRYEGVGNASNGSVNF